MFLVKKLSLIFVIFIFIYLASSAGTTYYDYFTRLASSFLQGKVYLNQNPPWLNELITLEPGKYTFVNPPMPGILATPFVFVFGKNFEQQYLAHILGAGIVILTYLLTLRFKKDKKIALWVSLTVGLGSILWYMSSTGSVWYLGQITAFFFMMMALFENFGARRPLLIGILLSCALLSRLQVIFAVPFFLTYVSENKRAKEVGQYLLGLFVFVFLYSSYNSLRFGAPHITGYRLLPNIFDEPWFSEGQFSLSYIPRHLNLLFLQLPKVIDHAPYIYPSWAGLSTVLTTPTFVYAFTNLKKDKLTILSFAAILGIGLINFSYGSTGFTQFGYRYAMDFYPFLILLVIKSVTQTGLKWHHWLLLAMGIVVNLWGVLWINKFGWVWY